MVVASLILGRGWRVRVVVTLLTATALGAIWVLGERTLFWSVPMTLAVALALAALVVKMHGARRRGLVTIAILGSLAAVWTIGDRLRSDGWRDTDGFIDCAPACNGWHLLGASLHYAPGIIGIVVVLVLFAAAVVEESPIPRSPQGKTS
jgi:hypothetical protein